MSWNITKQGSRGFFCDLLASVGRLEMEYASGRSDLKSYLDGLKELQELTYRRRIRPYFVRAWWAAALGVLLLAFSHGAEDLLCEQAMVTANVLDALSLVGIICLLLAAFLFHVFFRRESEHGELFQGLSGFVRKAGPSTPAKAEKGQV